MRNVHSVNRTVLETLGVKFYGKNCLANLSIGHLEVSPSIRAAVFSLRPPRLFSATSAFQGITR